MKIVSIKFLNLNSLKGEHEIRFDQPPFNESGIFAITGPTGAGKTTLLDAITVALYGRVHRHSKDVFEIMTRHTAESYAEVEFEVGLQTYRAKWSIRRSRGRADGALQTQKMELSDVLTGKIIIEHPLQEVRDEIVKLCGLDYNQFLRSVILSQGDFTRFLKADENERSELLEKITDTGIYSQISMAAYEKAREERVKLEQLRGRLENVVLLTSEERAVYVAQLKALSDQETKLKIEESGLRAKLNWLDNLGKLEARKQELLHNLSEAELFHAQHEPRFTQLNHHLRALVHRPALAELQAIENQQQRIGLDLQAAQLQYPEVTKEESAIKVTLTAAKEKATLKEKELTELEPIFDAAGKKDILIEQAKNQADRTRITLESGSAQLLTIETSKRVLDQQLIVVQERIDYLSKWFHDHAADAGLNKEVVILQQLVQQMTTLQLKINSSGLVLQEHTRQKEQGQVVIAESKKSIDLSNGQLLQMQQELLQFSDQLLSLLAGKTTDQLEEELRELPVLINTSEQQLKLAGAHYQLTAEETVLSESLAGYKIQHTAAQALSAQLIVENEQAAELLNHLQQIYELEVKVQDYEADRAQLEPEKPCPLCGAVHHPFVQGNYKPRVTETADRRNVQQEKLRQLKIKLDQQVLVVNSLHHQLENAEKSLVKSKEALLQIQQEFAANNAKLPKPLDIDKIRIISAVIDKKRTQQQALQEQLRLARETQLQIVQLENRVNQQKEMLSGERNKFEQAGLKIVFAEKQIATVTQELLVATDENHHLQDQAKRLLEPIGLSFDFAFADTLIREMNERYSQHQQFDQELQRLQPDLRQKETELKNVLLAIKEKNDAIGLLDIQLKEEQGHLALLQEERTALFGTKDPLQERLQLTNALKDFKLKAEELQLLLQDKQEKVRIIEDRQVTLNTSFLQTKQLFKEHLDQLTTKINIEGLSSIAELNQLYLPDEEARKAQQLEKESAQKIASGKSLLNVTEKDLETEVRKALTTDLKVDLLPLLEEQLESLSIVQQQKGKVDLILSDDDQLKLKHAAVAEQMESQQKEFDRFQKLSALIGSADGKKFSRFAQGLTLARLTELANRHLLRLSDRYSILKSPEKDLDLQIIDGYQADVVRPMSTLSGGESFLVSLALALGLSDLASRKVQINSLFIDEGFGTLDAETLDVAITALENLQASGKNIGIISHVEALKDRIGTQIQLSRLPGGTSKISLYSYGNRVEK